MTKHRYFRVSINILFIHVTENTRIFTLKSDILLVILSVWYSLICLLFGWWGFSIRNPFGDIISTLESIHINITGGINSDKIIDESHYDEETNFVWNNLLRSTIDKVNKNEINLILEIQEEYHIQGLIPYTQENINFISSQLASADIHRIRKNELLDILDAIKMYYEGN